MPASQAHIDFNTPLGANLSHDGATFRTWVPEAREMYLVLGKPGGEPSTYAKNPDHLLVKDANGRDRGDF
jgi:hypothetical protein